MDREKLKHWARSVLLEDIFRSKDTDKDKDEKYKFIESILQERGQHEQKKQV